MLLRAIIFFSAAAFGSTATSETSDVGANQATAFADAVWTYVVDTCPANALADDEMNAQLKVLLAAPLGEDGPPSTVIFETIGKNIAAQQMSDLDKRGIAVTVIGASGVVDQLAFFNTVVDADHLSDANYLEQEARLRDRALASLGLMECLWPSSEEVMNPPVPSGWGPAGEQMWTELAQAVYVGECDIEFLQLSRSYLEADFASVLPDDRDDFASALRAEHEQLIAAEAADERCEDFS